MPIKLCKKWLIHKGLPDFETKSNSNCEPSMASYLFFGHDLHDQFDQRDTDIQNNVSQGLTQVMRQSEIKDLPDFLTHP